MLYEFSLAIPANTPATAPVSVDAPLAPGRVAQVGILFPTGCAGLVHARIFRSNHQVWPSNPDGHIIGNGQEVTWPEDYDLDDAPFGFVCHGFNRDDTYPHVLTFRFAVIDADKAKATQEAASFLGRLRQLIGV